MTHKKRRRQRREWSEILSWQSAQKKIGERQARLRRGGKSSKRLNAKHEESRLRGEGGEESRKGRFGEGKERDQAKGRSQGTGGKGN